MELNTLAVYEILKSKGVDFLYHANSVQTSCTFLKNGSLLSRGVVQRRGFRQTEQPSDVIDQKYGVWLDIFTDSVDIHQRANRRNTYGPVLFKINIDILKTLNLPPLWITKKNPTKWIDGELHYGRMGTSMLLCFT